ncbi:TolB family protein [Nonomuraea sp. NPDC050556]|uniref:TolB family protein n=1 Tax=Nonomuraea sp. NPDC050556 TaxID=3364369 RepID=UPI0037987695
MRHTSAAVALLATTVIGGVAAVPAQAASSAGSSARAVWIKSCSDKEQESTAPCGHWQLIMRDGSKKSVADAAVFSQDANGSKSGSQAIFAISGDGRWIVYERARDHRLVVRKAGGGAVTELPKALVPRSLGTYNVSVFMSPSGDRVLVHSQDEKVPGRVVTVATGAMVKFRAGDTLSGFSADGDEVLATRNAKDNTTTLLAYRVDGSTVKQTPPQVVMNAGARALAADGHTVAAIVSGKKAPRLRLYDLETGQLSAPVELGLKAEALPYLAAWTGDGQLTVKVQSGGDGAPTVIREFTVDVATGATSKTDSYSISKLNYSWYAAGE